jgi:uncharacterized protein
MSVAEERSTETTVISPIADPGPLGLAAFALTTFLLSAANAGWMTKASGFAWLGYGFFYGGLVQLLAGMWEFRNRNVFGATAFSTYGAFWLGLSFWGRYAFAHPLAALVSVHDLGWILLAFAIFNTYMMLLSAQINSAVFGVFLTLELTEIVLFIGFFTNSSGTIKLGGYVGVVTAAVAWYASAALVSVGVGGPMRLPLGPALVGRR